VILNVCCNSTMAKAMGLIFLLFDIASARGFHGRDNRFTVINVVHYSSLFRYFFPIYYDPYSIVEIFLVYL